MSIRGKELIEQGEEMIDRGEEMMEKGHEMEWGETVMIEEGHEMKKREMLERGRQMVERGEEKVEKGRKMRKRDIVRNWRKELSLRLEKSKEALTLWRLLGKTPFVVALIAGVSGWLAREGVGYSRMTSEMLVNPLYYVELLIVHSGWEHFIANMYFFLPAGMAMTYFTNNKKVLVVVAVSHTSAVLTTGVALEQMVTGTAAAAYGLLAATAVRTTYIGSKRYSPSAQISAPVGMFFISGVGILMMGAVVGSFLQNVPLIVGFAAGGALECLTVISKTRGTDPGEMEETEKMGAPTQ